MSDFDFSGDRLADAWEALHRGDQEPWPDAARMQTLLDACPDIAEDEDPSALADALQEAWRAHHEGRFEDAVAAADACGLVAHAAANKATGIMATYLLGEGRAQTRAFEAAVERAERAIERLPDDANAHYFHAFNLGRYSQSISVVKALKQGVGGKIHASLTRALELAPDHAEAHTALGMYHAEIIDKVGKMIGGMTYGASASEALAHFERAIELTPESPIAHIEYGNGLYLLYGDKRIDDVTDLYVRASEMTPKDVMERLDIEAALAELE